MENEIEQYRKDCWDLSLHAYGTAYIFRKKATKYKKLTSRLKFFGIAVPLSVGATALGYGIDSDVLKWAFIFAIPLIIIQLIISLSAMINHWDEELYYAYESASENLEIALRYENIAKYPPELNELKSEMNLLKTKQESRDKQDDKHNVTEKEERMGMRYALRYYQRSCANCGNAPTSMNPTNCNICGNF